MNIKVYTMDNCIFCVNQKKWMDDNQISYKEGNIKEEKYRNEFMDIGASGTPTTVIEKDLW